MKKSMIEAFEFKRKGYYKQAIEIYYKLLSSLGDDVEILSELADLYYLLKNNERAMHYVNKSLEIVPNHESSLRVLKNVYNSEQKYESAETVAKQIYDITGQDDDLLELLEILEHQGKNQEIIDYAQETDDEFCKYKSAIAMCNINRYDEALDILGKIVLSENIDLKLKEDVLNLKAEILNKRNDTERVKEVYKKLEETNAQTAEGLNNIGLDKLDNLQLDEAVEYFRLAIDKDNQNAQYHYNMGQSYYLKGWFEEAKKCFNTAICLNPMEEKYHYSLAYMLYRCGEYEAAEAHLNPDYRDSKVLQQVIKAEKGDLATPKIELEKMLKDNPENETILYSLAKIYYQLDMYKQSKMMIEETIKVNPKSFEYQMFNVRLLLKLGLVSEAEQKSSEMVEKYPNYYYAKVLEAEVNLAKKDYDALYDSAQDLIELDINHYEGYYYNALALFEKEDINFAIESLKKAIMQDVNNADLYVKMSEFYQAIGKYEDAFEYIKEASDIDKSAKNQELYMQLASILRRKGLTSKNQ